MAEPSQEVLEDLMIRFVLTAPKEQLTTFEHMMFLVEHAWWHYEDLTRVEYPGLKSYSLAEFASLLFKTCSQLAPYLPHVDDIIRGFNEYKRSIPVMGGILLDSNMERVLLVKGVKAGAKWGFPRGKINKTETDAECAVREVLEETGYDIEKKLKEDDFIEIYADGKKNKLYIVTGVDPETTVFAPQVRQEIGGFAWHRVADLPSSFDDSKRAYHADTGGQHRFFGVWPFIGPLQKWIERRKKLLAKGAAGARSPVKPHTSQAKSNKAAKANTTLNSTSANVASVNGSTINGSIVKNGRYMHANHSVASRSITGNQGVRTVLLSFQFDRQPILDSLNLSIATQC